jgi:hypothetical protein
MIIGQNKAVLADDKPGTQAMLFEFPGFGLLLAELGSEKPLEKGIIEHIFGTHSFRIIACCGLFHLDVDTAGFAFLTTFTKAFEDLSRIAISSLEAVWATA